MGSGEFYFFVEHDAPPAYETVEHVLVKVDPAAKTAETVGRFDYEAFPNVSCLLLNRDELQVSLDATSLEMLVGKHGKAHRHGDPLGGRSQRHLDHLGRIRCNGQ